MLIKIMNYQQLYNKHNSYTKLWYFALHYHKVAILQVF